MTNFEKREAVYGVLETIKQILNSVSDDNLRVETRSMTFDNRTLNEALIISKVEGNKTVRILVELNRDDK